MPPSLSDLQTLVTRSYNWIVNSVLEAPESDGVHRGRYRVGMYRALPIVVKVRPGYTIPNANTNCHYVRHLGSQAYVNGDLYPQITIHDTQRTANAVVTQLEVGPWPDGQPSLWFQVNRNFSVDPATGIGWCTVDVYYFGKPQGDTRQYPVDLYWGRTRILDDHRSKGAGWFWHGAWPENSPWMRSNKYFIRTEDQVALKLLTGSASGSWVTGLNTWCANLWTDTHADVHSPLFGMGLSKANDYVFRSGAPMYRDCNLNHQGCPADWPADLKRDAPYPNGYGFSHRSKVCTWPQAYTWVLAQDGLGLLSQAIHVLLKSNNPWTQYTSPWPWGVPGGPPNPVTPVQMAQFVWDKWYRTGVGVSMFQVPFIGADSRASSLRTNHMGVLATLLGYRYLVGGWAAKADQIADILRQVSVGGPTQPNRGVRTADLGDIVRPDYFGSQLFVWDDVGAVGSAAASGGSLGLKDFGWFRQTLNELLNLPPDDNDFILSTVETTATYCQALRTYAYHKYRWQFGARATIPG